MDKKKYLILKIVSQKRKGINPVNQEGRFTDPKQKQKRINPINEKWINLKTKQKKITLKKK